MLGTSVVCVCGVGVFDVFGEGVLEDLLAQLGWKEAVVEQRGNLRVVGVELERYFLWGRSSLYAQGVDANKNRVAGHCEGLQ